MSQPRNPPIPHSVTTSQRYLVARHRPQSPLAPGARAWSPGAAWQHSDAAERKAQRAGRRTGEFSQPPVRWAGGSCQTSPFRQLRTPTIRVGRLLRAPVRAMERLLDQTCRDFATAEPKRNGQHIISCGLVRLPSAWTSTPKALSRCERGGFSGCCVSATRSSAPARERVRSQSAEG